MTGSTETLRRGWTTGACAAAAAKSACAALVAGEFHDPVTITIPGGQTPAFPLATWNLDAQCASAGIVKDAGDDPDVTHGALIVSTVRRGLRGSGIRFRAGEGVGTVTRPGLPIPPGEPAINPMPRRMIAQALMEVAGRDADFEVTVSVPDGEQIALRTLNGRLGIVGGISILGTTGIVIPYSCSAWIASIHRGIDVARAAGFEHVAAATGSTSEQAVQKIYGLSDVQLIDMGDFAGGTLKYLRRHPVPRVTIAGGMAKMTKLSQGLLDLHSSRGATDMDRLSRMAGMAGADAALMKAIVAANTVAEVFELADRASVRLGDAVAMQAWSVAAAVLDHREIELEIIVFDRSGHICGRTPFRVSHH